jgi:tetratricopeptide (TPR) repeat protein
MKLFSIAAGVALLALVVSPSLAAVVVKTAKKSFTGESITQMTALQVTIKKGALETKIPVNVITEIRYGGESTLMPKVRQFVVSGRYEDAVELLGKIKSGVGLNKYITQDVEFYRAYCHGQMALGGTFKKMTAASELTAFAKSHPGSYHYLACRELLGRLAVALGEYDSARRSYGELNAAPWPDYKIHALTALGEAELAQGNFTKAESTFDLALKIEADDDRSKQNLLVALIGKGRCQAENGNIASGITTVNKVIKDLGPEARMLLPRAYLALGYCYKKDGKPQEAVLQFLMVDLVYNAHRASHADALKNLVGLWRSINKIENSRKAKARLQQLYPGVG